MSNGNPSRKRRSRHKTDIEPITLDELLGGAGMSGFLGILDPPVPVPHLQKLVDEIRLEQDTVASHTRQDTVALESTVAAEPTVGAVDTAATQDTVSLTTTVASKDTVLSLAAPKPWPARIRRMKTFQDGHTKAEQLLYAAMWSASQPEGPGENTTRILTRGYDQLSTLSGLYWSAVKRNLRSLEQKLAIETIASENSNERVGRTYRIYCSTAVLKRRFDVGLTLVRRWRGSAELLSEDTVLAQDTVASGH